jgi:UDP-N-acetylglucosamine 2-epimerase (non-hydrolysing)
VSLETSDLGPLAIACGTRPEALKLVPVVAELRRRGRLSADVIFSGQHGELLAEIAREIGLVPDRDLSSTYGDESLSSRLARLLEALDGALAGGPHRGVVVQGDTNTALAAALVGFHRSLPVFHVEAGLRTRDPHRPFPEEMNRRLITRIATRHYAPTAGAAEALHAEGIDPSAVRVTGNTIVDTLYAHREVAQAAASSLLARANGRRVVVVTLHRRENLDSAGEIAQAMEHVARRFDVHVFWVSHPNATGQEALSSLTFGSAVQVLSPQRYSVFLGLMQAAALIISDSGGVQEEAPALGVPLLVLRSETERPEGLLAGSSRLVAPTSEALIRVCAELLGDEPRLLDRGRSVSTFGDGSAGVRIVDDLEAYFGFAGSDDDSGSKASRK